MTMEVSTVGAATAALPQSVSVRCGKGTKVVQHFTGRMSARDIKAEIKATGVKGAELTRMVNAVLTGEKDLRGQLGVAWVQATIQSGFIPDKGELGKNSAVLRFVKVKAVEAVKPVALKDQVLGLSEAEKAELRALLA